MKKYTDIAWLSGIVDGEGCFQARLISNKSLFFSFRLENTSSKMIDKVKEILSNNKIEFKIYSSLRRHNSTKDIFRVEIGKKLHLLQFCNLIFPYLITKKDECECLITFLLKSCKTKHFICSEEDKLIINQLKLMKKIN